MSISVLTIVIIMLSSNMVYAKYIASDKINSVFNVATPIFIVEGKETTKISEINNIGYYEFSIKNFNQTSISETGFLYTIEILSNTDESIQFELYNEEVQIPLEKLKTQQLAIKANEKIEQNYKLKVILEEVQLKVHSEQEQI